MKPCPTATLQRRTRVGYQLRILSIGIWQRHLPEFLTARMLGSAAGRGSGKAGVKEVLIFRKKTRRTDLALELTACDTPLAQSVTV
jgi:hypothetical protein